MLVRVQPGSDKSFTARDGKRTFRLQEIWVQFEGEEFPRPATIFLEDEQAPHEVGQYELDISKSLEVRKDRLQFGKLTLKRLASNPADRPAAGGK